MDETDRAILRELEEGVPMVEQPFAEIGSRLRIPEEEVITRIRLNRPGFDGGSGYWISTRA